MGNRLTGKQYIFAIIYSAIFPLSGLLGKTIGLIALFITIPFLPIAWIGGMALVDIFNTDSVYLIGLYFSVLLQVLVVLKFSHKSNKNDKSKRKLFIWSK